MPWIKIQSFFLLGSALVTAAIGLYCLRRRDVPSAVYLAWLMLPVTIWAFSWGQAELGLDAAQVMLWQRVAFTAIAFMPAAGWVFIAHFSGHASWLTRRHLAILFLPPLATALVIWTNSMHRWFIYEYVYPDVWKPGFWYWLYVGYCFLVVGAFIYVSLRTALYSPQPYRGQALMILAWAGVSLGFSVASTFGGVFPFFYNLPRLLPLLNSLGFAWAVFRFRLFDLLPVARETLIENMSDSVLVLDRSGRVVDANLAWERLARVSKAAVIGRPVAQLPAPWNELAGQISGALALSQKEIILDRAAEQQYLHLQITPLQGRGESQGYLLVFHDLMSQKLMEALEERVTARTRDLSTLYEVSSLINERSDLPAILSGCLSQVIKATRCEAGLIFPGGPAQEITRQGISQDDLAQLTASPFWAHKAEKREPILVHQRDLDQQVKNPLLFGNLLPAGFPFQSLIAAPIRLREDLGGDGILVALAALPHHFNVEDLGLLVTISEQVGIAIENDHLRRQARSAAVDAERQRLARDLHDSIAQMLYSQILFTSAAQKHLQLNRQDQAVEYLDRLNATAKQALREMRLLIYQLRPPELKNASLEEMLLRRFEMVEQRSGIAARLEGQWQLPSNPALHDALYRMVEEALNNALKHAQPSEVLVACRQDPQGFSLEIIDNGCGFNVEETSAGMGMHNLRERAAQLGGALAISSEKGCGTRVSIRLPMPVEEISV